MKRTSPVLTSICALILLHQMIVFAATEPAFSGYPTLAQEKPSWKRITGKDEEFSIAMPGEPSLCADEISTRLGDHREERIYSSYDSGSLYLVASYPGSSSSFDYLLRLFQLHHRSNQSAITFERDLVVDRGIRKQYKWELNETNGTLQLIFAKSHAYVVAIIQAVNDPVETSHFLSSFSLKTDARNGEKGVIVSDTLYATMQSEGNASPLPFDSHEESPERIFTGKEVTKKALVVSRPEPSYTEEARVKGIAGTVVIRAVLSSTGKVKNIRAITALKAGLTENALNAARHLRFIPAIKDGRFVSQYMQIEYSYGLV